MYMTVSSRKMADFQDSLSKGSAEDADHTCEPCLAIDKHIEAHGFCVECHEYLCTNCFAYHQRIKATKHHQLVKDDMAKYASTKKGSDECFEKCQVHKREVIKFFCPVHEALGCNDCITLNHRTCDIDYIPDKCAGIGDSEDYRQVMKELDEKVNKAEDVLKLAENREREIDICHDQLLKELMKFRKEINDRLDQLQNQIQTGADKKKVTDKQTVKKVLETCTAVSSDIKQLKSRLQDNKTSQQNGQLYTAMKLAQSKLKSDEILEADRCLEQTHAQYIFEPSNDLQNMLSRQNALGKLSLSTSLVTAKRKKIIEKLTLKKEIDMYIKSNEHECYISGSVLLSSGTLVVANYKNSKLEVVDMQKNVVTEEKRLGSTPWDIALLPEDQIAVTMPHKREILIMSTAGKLLVIRRIPVQGRCRGITYHQGLLYTVCVDRKCVCVIDTQGNVQNIISLDNRFRCPNYILVNEDQTRIYISDCRINSVFSITFQGVVSAEYKRKDFKEPQGMLMLGDGSLLLCCYGSNGSIYRISGDLKQGQTMIRDMWTPHSLSCNRNKDEIYVGCYSDMLKVFSAT